MNTVRLDRFQCRFCNSDECNPVEVAELHLGLNERFTYQHCTQCGILQIENIPDDLSPYYPGNYYSYSASPVVEQIRTQRRTTRVARALVARHLMSRNALGAFVARRRKWLTNDFPHYLINKGDLINLRFESKILDVGCGAGAHLLRLALYGFRKLEGVDPFVSQDIRYGDAIVIRKKRIEQVEGKYDLLLMNHSLEHVPDPMESLRTAFSLIVPGGSAIIRIPVLAHAWEKYRENWVQLDAPRHLTLFPADTFCRLVESIGYRVRDVEYDSSAFQFWASEQYLRGIPLRSERSYANTRDESVFSAQQMAAWEDEARAVNRQGKGDQAIFVLHKPR